MLKGLSWLSWFSRFRRWDSLDTTHGTLVGYAVVFFLSVG